jgi:hypothetical protein
MVGLASVGMSCTGAVSVEDLGQGAAERGVTLTCNGSFQWVAVPGAVCLDGTGTGFMYRCFSGVGATGPLVINFDGGGACWDGDTCELGGPGGLIERNHFDANDAGSVVPQVFAQANYSGSTSAFNQSWNQVFIPYCTGDVNSGNKVQNYVASDGTHIAAHHVGFHNVALDLAVLGSLFPNPAKVAMWGSSGGGLAVDCNLSAIHSKWPSRPMYSLNNSGAPLNIGFDTDVTNLGGPTMWGVYHIANNLTTPDTCPIVTPTGAPWNPAFVINWNSQNMSMVRKAMVDDLSDATMNGFANALSCATAQYDNANACTVEPADTLNCLRTLGYISNTTTYKVYYHTGDCHAEREQDGNAEPACDYDNMIESGAGFSSWVRGWV